MNREKKPFESKKFIALVVGVSFTSLFTLGSLIMIGLVPNASSAIVNLITVSLASLNGVIGLYTVGQSSVDWQIRAQNKSEQSNTNNEETRRLIIEGGKEREVKYEDISDGIDWDKVKEEDL